MGKQDGKFHSVVLSFVSHFCSACAHYSACDELRTTELHQDPGVTSRVCAGFFCLIFTLLPLPSSTANASWVAQE